MRGRKAAAGGRKARIGEVCKLLDHGQPALNGQPALRLAPFKLSTLARTPFVARIQVLIRMRILSICVENSMLIDEP